MKKFLLVTAILAAASVSAAAASIDCQTSWGAARASGYSCTSDDKLFSNFMNGTSGPDAAITAVGLPDLWTVTIGEIITDQHYVDITAAPNRTPLIAGATKLQFGISYTVSVIAGNPTKSITQVNVGATLNAGIGSPQIRTVEKWVYDSSGALLGAGNAVVGSDVIMLTPGQQLINVQELITLQNGDLSAFKDTYIQAGNGGSVPEPATYGMMGLGLAALGLIARRKKA